jgi:2'-5' RNA ligase
MAVREMSSGSEGPLRVLDAELLHVTLCFLGDCPTEKINAIATRLAACAGPTGEISLGAPLWLPARHPRALAVELHDDQGQLAILQGSISTALEEPGDLRSRQGRGPHRSSKHRHFRPHVTVARMRAGAAPRERVLPPTPGLFFIPRELVLYRSWLSPEGATYEAVATQRIA